MTVLLLLLAVTAWSGPYPPAAGEPGSTAVHTTNALFVGWATGWTNYVVGEECNAEWQTPELALGQAEGDIYSIVCLGRGGSITLTFDTPIADGPGYDFAVFENAFLFADLLFLELAYVEVSSDGTNFFRFPSDSQTTNAVDSFGEIDPTDVDGLAGKYRQGYGMPFDLATLSGVSTQLDAQAVGFVRIVDIVGDGSALDTSGDRVYDPYPTSASAGFDLDAVGVINAPLTGAIDATNTNALFGWESQTNRLYQVQYADGFGNHEWRDLGGPVAGDGQAHWVSDTNAAVAARFYRVLEIRP